MDPKRVNRQMVDDVRSAPGKAEVRAESDAASTIRLRRRVDFARDHARGGGSDGVHYTVVAYNDFLCPYCRRLRGVLAQLRQALGERLVYVFRHSPDETAHPGATFMSCAAEAAHKQGRFWDMHDRLYDAELALDAEDALSIARDLGLDIAQFERDLNATETIQRVRDDLDEGKRNGIAGTPTIFVDGIRYDGAWDFHSMLEGLMRPLAARLERQARAFANLPSSAGVVLLAASLTALVCANSPLAPYYHQFIGSTFSIGATDGPLSLTIRSWFAEGLLSIFFLLVGLEVRREVTSGALSDRRAAILPVVAAVGGVLIPAAIYLSLSQGPTTRGWPIPTATDIAFTLGVLALFESRVPSALRVFVATVAVVDDILSGLTLAIFFPRGFDVIWLIVGAAFAAALYALNRCRVYAGWLYVVIAAAIWLALHNAGIHAALAGMILAIFLPTRPAPQAGPLLAQAATALDTLEVAQRDMRSFGQQRVWDWASSQLAAASDRLVSPAERIERAVAPWTAYVILPIFAFSATGVALDVDFSDSGAAQLTVGIIFGLVLGKPIGIGLAALAAIRSGIAMAPKGVRLHQFVGAACLCGIGYGGAMLMSEQVFGQESYAAIAKLAILASSLFAAMLAQLFSRWNLET